MTFSTFGSRLSAHSGINELMDDLGQALAAGGMRMLGGGNPASIPAVQAIWRQRLHEMSEASGGDLDRALANYDPPRGNPRFLEALAGLLNAEYGWGLTPDNIAVTAGGQSAFFFLFNLLAGEMPDGSRKKILLPLAPEYIGYANQGACDDLFYAAEPKIELTGEREFKYRVDFDRLRVGDDIAAICASRPTNPTGNVLTDGEVRRLAEMADAAGIPLILDNAYGLPFPAAIFEDAAPVWNENIILTMSLSKLGLPGTRTGIVIAKPEVADAIGRMTAVVGLANGNLGQAIAAPLIQSGEILRISRELICPFYREKSGQAQAWVHEAFGGEGSYRIHRSEGAFFLWLWFEGMQITSRELYARLKKRGVIVVPGEYFFFGMDAQHDDWRHRHECIRMSFAMAEDDVREGIRIIAEEVKAAM
ncbi:MAG: valine--pyruvate transaminase [Verrucomicrobiales bacterium]